MMAYKVMILWYCYGSQPRTDRQQPIQDNGQHDAKRILVPWSFMITLTFVNIFYDSTLPTQEQQYYEGNYL
jgi:hypothetical protein